MYGDEMEDEDEGDDDLKLESDSEDEAETIAKMKNVIKADKKPKDIQGFEKGGNLDKSLKSAK